MSAEARPRSLWPMVVSGFAAALALLVSTYNVYLQRTQIRAQVWPHLEWWTANVDGYAFMLQNSGVGPAQIEAVRVTVDGVPVKDWHEALQRVSVGRTHIVTSTLRERVVGAGVTIEPLRIRDEADARRFGAAVDRIDIEVCYCSTLGDCWRLRAGIDTERVDGCSTQGELFDARPRPTSAPSPVAPAGTPPAPPG